VTGRLAASAPWWGFVIYALCVHPVGKLLAHGRTEPCGANLTVGLQLKQGPLLGARVGWAFKRVGCVQDPLGSPLPSLTSVHPSDPRSLATG
jgi:hypothetical protein